jgi:hypothetical protein
MVRIGGVMRKRYAGCAFVKKVFAQPSLELWFSGLICAGRWHSHGTSMVGMILRYGAPRIGGYRHMVG